MSTRCMKLVVGMGFALLATGMCPAATITVDLGGAGDFTEIQPAIDAASDGDTVLVMPGEYVITESIRFNRKAITLRSESGREETVIRISDPDFLSTAGMVEFWSLESDASLLDGFTLDGSELFDLTLPTSTVYCVGSSPTLVNCSISGSGEGVTCYSSSSPTLINCTISGRIYGVYCVGSSPTLENCTILRNKVGVYSRDCSPALENCMILRNELSGVESGGDPSPILTNCTILGNAVGVRCGNSSPTLMNCIVWNNDGGPFQDDSCLPEVTFSCIEGGWEGEGNISDNPLFIDSTAGDFHLQPGSPCIDAGTGEGAPLMDIDGDPRPCGEQVDMGAYELCPNSGTLFLRGDTNNDGTSDISDAVATLGFLFLGNPVMLECEKSADSNDTGRIDLSDAVYILNHLFLGSDAPAEPFPECGNDPTDDDGLDCAEFSACPNGVW